MGALGGLGGIGGVRISPPQTSGRTSFVYDSFTDTESTALASHTPDVDITAGGWSSPDEGFTIESNKCSDNQDARSISIIDSGVADVIVSATITPSDNFCALIARYQDATKYFVAGLGIASGETEIWINNAGFTKIANDTFVSVEGTPYFVEFRLSGNSLELYVDSVLYSSATNSNFASDTICGLYSDPVAPSIDALYEDFRVLRLATADT
jgi:hypothetical protein